jgi:hypothetical protein
VRRVLGALLFLISFTTEAAGYALVIQDETPLRQTPGASAKPSTVLWQGELVEVRGERIDYLQVWDYTRERGGYVRASQVRVLALSEDEAPELLAVLRFLRNVPGSEALGIGIAAAYIEAAPAESLNGADGIEALEAMGTIADRLARNASGATQLKAVAVSAHLEVAARYGVRFVSVEQGPRMRVCYDGAAWKKLLSMSASEEQHARAALALSEPACAKPEVTMAEALGRIDAAALPGYLRNRVLMRGASLWASVAYHLARAGEDARGAAGRALELLARVDAGELAETDRAAYAEAGLRVGAARVALADASPTRNLYIVTEPGDEGRTCAVLMSANDQELKRRCTYGVVWRASAVSNRQATALTLCVQHSDAWRELWIFRKTTTGWSVRVLPPAADPGIGFADFAGWTPGGVRVKREAIVAGRVARSTRLVRLT